MEIIYLAGNSLGNKSWIVEVKAKFDLFSTGYILNYDHWQSGEKWINLDKESEKLVELAKDKSDYFVFAKSIGSVLALKNIFEKKLIPKKMIVCGFPYHVAKKENLLIDEYLKKLSVPTIFIQNEFDPACSLAELEKTLKENSPTNYQLVKNPNNNTHDYVNFEKLSKVVGDFFKRQSN